MDADSAESLPRDHLNSYVVCEISSINAPALPLMRAFVPLSKQYVSLDWRSSSGSLPLGRPPFHVSPQWDLDFPCSHKSSTVFLTMIGSTRGPHMLK